MSVMGNGGSSGGGEQAVCIGWQGAGRQRNAPANAAALSTPSSPVSTQKLTKIGEAAAGADAASWPWRSHAQSSFRREDVRRWGEPPGTGIGQVVFMVVVGGRVSECVAVVEALVAVCRCLRESRAEHESIGIAAEAEAAEPKMCTARSSGQLEVVLPPLVIGRVVMVVSVVLVVSAVLLVVVAACGGGPTSSTDGCSGMAIQTEEPFPCDPNTNCNAGVHQNCLERVLTVLREMDLGLDLDRRMHVAETCFHSAQVRCWGSLTTSERRQLWRSPSLDL